MATRYTRSAKRSRLAARAMNKLHRAETETGTSIPAPGPEVRAKTGEANSFNRLIPVSRTDPLSDVTVISIA